MWLEVAVEAESILYTCADQRACLDYYSVSRLSQQHLIFQKMMNLSLIYLLGSPPHSSHSNIILSPSESLKLYSRKSRTEINWSFAFDINRADFSLFLWQCSQKDWLQFKKLNPRPHFCHSHLSPQVILLSRCRPYFWSSQCIPLLHAWLLELRYFRKLTVFIFFLFVKTEHDVGAKQILGKE